MPLDEALCVLLETHLGYDWRGAGWSVKMGALPAHWLSQKTYVEAWAAVRDHRLAYEGGRKEGVSKETCGQCGGTGKILSCPMSFDGDSDRLIPDIGCEEWEPCDECDGTGLWDA